MITTRIGLLGVILISIACLPQLASAQQWVTITFVPNGDSVTVGDTGNVGRMNIVTDPNTDCRIWDLYGGGQRRGSFHDSSGVIFYPSKSGVTKDTFSYWMNFVPGGCGIETVSVPLAAVGISDSQVLIRPRGWRIGMRLDSEYKTFRSISIPLFSNNISDTTLFSNFSLADSSIQLQVFDSLTPITEYRAMPFERKKPLVLVFSSVNFVPYYGIDLIVKFSTRIRHHNVDSNIIYPLAFQWIAPAGITKGQSPGQDYALPNPFTTHTTIGFSLAGTERVKLQLFDITGQSIREIERECVPGTNEIDLDTRDLPPGCYWYVLHGGEWERSGKVVKLSPVWTGF